MTNNEIIINVAIVVTIVVVYLIAKNWRRYDKEFLKLYQEIINSDKYKVKGKQYN